MAITVSNTGYIKRTAISTYRNQRRGGKGRIGMRTRDEDFVSHLFVASTHAYIMIFSDRGRAYWLKVHEIPDVGPGGKGKSIANLVSMEEGETIAALLAVKEFDDNRFVVMGTRKGVVKKTALSAFSNPRAGGIIAMGVEDGDAVIAVQVTDGDGEVFIGTRDGMAIRFAGDRRPADGPHGLRRPRHHAARRRLRRGDGGREAGRHAARRSPSTATASAPRSRSTACSRAAASASSTSRRAERNGQVVGVAYVQEGDEVLLITQQGMILRMQTNDVRAIGRATQGVTLIDIEGDDKVVSIAQLVEKEDEPDAADAAPEAETSAVVDAASGPADRDQRHARWFPTAGAASGIGHRVAAEAEARVRAVRRPAHLAHARRDAGGALRRRLRGCGRRSLLLDRFFDASRLLDRTELARFATVVSSPAGTASSSSSRWSAAAESREPSVPPQASTATVHGHASSASPSPTSLESRPPMSGVTLVTRDVTVAARSAHLMAPSRRATLDRHAAARRGSAGQRWARSVDCHGRPRLVARPAPAARTSRAASSGRPR